MTRARTAGVLGALTFASLLLLSSWMAAAVGGRGLARDDRFFGSDTRSWLARMVGVRAPAVPNFELGTHPAGMLIWRAPGRLMATSVSMFSAAPEAAALAGRLLVALVAAVGVGSLVLAAMSLEIAGPRLWWLFALYLSSSVNLIVALPDYYGISQGLLSLFFASHILTEPGARRRILVTGLGILIAGTTISNLVLPLMTAAQSWIRSRSLRMISGALLVASAPAALFALGLAASSSVVPARAATFVSDLKSYTLHFTRPVARRLSVEDMALATVSPIVAPSSALQTTPGRNAIRFDSRDLIYRYGFVELISALGWVSLLIASGVQAASAVQRRPHFRLLAGWIAFNLIFHAVWGDDPFLYAPHWSWALFGIVLLGAGQLPRAFVAGSCLVALPGQIQLLAAFRHAATGLQ